MITTTTKTILFLGATGGVTNACLIHTLRSSPPGTHCVALVRTPSKLRTLLESQDLTPEQLSSSRLTILQGDATDPTALKTALQYDPAHPHPAHVSDASSTTTTTTTINATTNPLLPTAIITGLGGAGSLTWNACAPLEIVKIDQPSICTDAARALVSALRDIYATLPPPQRRQQKPRLIFVSTTGITQGPEDVPYAMRFLYHRVLREPHVDKREMERVFRAEGPSPAAAAAAPSRQDRQPGSGSGLSADGTGSEKPQQRQQQQQQHDGVFGSVTGIRPTLLTGESGVVGTGKGWESVKAGTESKPALGYSIARADVGEWMWEAVLRGVLLEDGRGRGKWEGEMCSLTS